MGLTERAELVARLSLKDDFTAGVNKAIGNANAKTTGLAANFRGVGIAAGVGAAAGSFAFGALSGAIGQIGDFTEAATKAFIEDEQSVARLGAALKANIQNWDGNTKAIEGTINARMRLGFTDEEQRNSLGTLLSATHDVNEALEIQRVAMDLAAFSGKDLGSSVDALTKVEAGSYRILKSLGIVLRDGATQAEALAAVEAVAAGAAEALAGTIGGKLTASLIRSNEATESFGRAWAPVSLAIQDAQTSLLEFAARGLDGWRMLGEAADQFNKDTGRTIDGSTRHLERWGGEVEKELDKIPVVAAQAMKKTAEALSTGWTEAERATIKQIKDAGKIVDASFFTMDLAGVKEAMWRGGAGVMAALAAGINARRDLPLDSFDTLVEMLKHELTGPQEWARLQGQLFSADLAKGLKSKDPAVKAQANATLELIQTRLLQLGGPAELAGILAGDKLKAGLASKDTDVRNAAEATKKLITDRLAELTTAAGIAGNQAAAAYIEGWSGGGAAGKAAADFISKYQKDHPPGNLPPLLPTGEKPLPLFPTQITLNNYISGLAIAQDLEQQDTYNTRVPR